MPPRTFLSSILAWLSSWILIVCQRGVSTELYRLQFSRQIFPHNLNKPRSRGDTQLSRTTTQIRKTFGAAWLSSPSLQHKNILPQISCQESNLAFAH